MRWTILPGWTKRQKKPVQIPAFDFENKINLGLPLLIPMREPKESQPALLSSCVHSS